MHGDMIASWHQVLAGMYLARTYLEVEESDIVNIVAGGGDVKEFIDDAIEDKITFLPPLRDCVIKASVNVDTAVGESILNKKWSNLSPFQQVVSNSKVNINHFPLKYTLSDVKKNSHGVVGSERQ